MGAKKPLRRSKRPKTPEPRYFSLTSPDGPIRVEAASFNRGVAIYKGTWLKTHLALKILLSFYDRMAAGEASWTGSDAARLAEIRKMVNFE